MSNNISSLNGTVNSSAINLTARNGTTLEEKEIILSLTSLVCLSVFNGLFAVLGTCGNILVLLTVAKNTCLQTVPDLFIFSLATADLVVTLIQQPMQAYRIYHANSPTSNLLFNSSLESIGHLALLASVTSMFAVTIDRFVAIQRTFLYVELATKKRALRVIGVLWSLCLCITIATRFINVTIKNVIIWGYISVLLLLTIIMNISLFIAAKKQQNRIIKESTLGTISSHENSPQDDEGLSIPTRQKRELKAAKTIAIVIGVFIAFWTPLLGYTISNASISETPKFMRVFYWVLAISLWNSTINPYIYCARSRRYRSAFAKLLGLKKGVELDLSQQASYRRSQNQSATDPPNTLQRGVGTVEVCW